MTIEREVGDARNILDTGVVKDKRRESQSSSSSNSGKKHRTFILRGFQGQGRGFQGQGQVKAPGQTGQGRCFHCLSPSHQWDVHKQSLFLLTPPWVRRNNQSQGTAQGPTTSQSSQMG